MQRWQSINRPKPEQAKIRRSFTPTIDNMIGKEMAVLIMVHYRPYLHPKGSANNDTFACWLVHIPGLVPAYILQK